MRAELLHAVQPRHAGASILTAGTQVQGQPMGGEGGRGHLRYSRVFWLPRGTGLAWTLLLEYSMVWQCSCAARARGDVVWFAEGCELRSRVSVQCLVPEPVGLVQKPGGRW
jgi:hypothetical protein